ncbi:MAG: methionyl-tRNA formyltransferase [Pseudomonadota bacterium]
MRLIFMGTPDFAVPTLMELAGQGYDVAAVYTQPPRPRGRRGLKDEPSPVHKAALALGLEVRHPLNFKSEEALAEVEAVGADAIIVVAYGLILPERVLHAAKEGALNVHASLLPRWRGAAPIARAIMAGDAHTGVAVMAMEKGLDTGPVAMVERIDIAPTDTAGDLTDRLARLGADLMVRALGGVARGQLVFQPQPTEGITYAQKIDKGEAAIDFRQPAEVVRNHIHGLSPWPGAHATLQIAGKEERIKVFRAEAVAGEGEPGILLDDRLTVACQSGAVRFLEVQRAGKSAVSAAQFLQGARIAPGARFLG